MTKEEIEQEITRTREKLEKLQTDLEDANNPGRYIGKVIVFTGKVSAYYMGDKTYHIEREDGISVSVHERDIDSLVLPEGHVTTAEALKSILETGLAHISENPRASTSKFSFGGD